MPYASKTKVPVDRSRMEIESTLKRYGASQFISGWDGVSAVIGCTVRGRMIRFTLPLPPAKGMSEQRREQETRRLWRALVLVLKAKLEAVNSGIATFDHEFLPYIVMPDGKTVSWHVLPSVVEAYKSGKMPADLPLALPAPGETGK